MTLADETARFLDNFRKNQPSAQSRAIIHERVLLLLKGYFFPNVKSSQITAGGLRDFFARWYIETGGYAKRADQLPEPLDMLATVSDFLKWADRQGRTNVYVRMAPLLTELRHTLPRAVEISKSLSNWLRERGGAFSFPEFLTSFEEGGRSQYDIDEPDDDDRAVLEGHFRILRAEGSLVEAEESISGRQVWPIVFPAHVAALLDGAYTINLEVVRTQEGWQITGCGFAHPPGTDG